MAIASLTLGITGLFAWMVPFFGFPVSLVGLVLSALALWRSKEDKRKAVAGLITCIVGLVLNVVVVVVGITMIGMFEIFNEMFPGYFNSY